jgi:hypothetical protein
MRLGKKLVLCSAVLFATTATAQPPERGGQRGGERGGQRGGEREQTQPAQDLVTRMMAFDKDKDGKLKKDDITDERLQRLFDRADANKDGVVTKEELQALATQEAAAGGGRGGPGGPGGPGGERGGRGGDGGRGRGGEGGPGGFGGPGGPGGFGGGRGGPGGFMMPQPGQILPAFLAEQLKLTDDQKKQVEELQKETTAKLEKLLTDDQKKTLKEMKERGPMGPGGPGGRGGPGGPGGEGGRGPGGPGGPGGGRGPGGDR